MKWLVGDVTTLELEPSCFELWHDRAVFHFLTERAEREAYVARARRVLVPGGHIVIGTFSLTGPARCSGLDVVRYDADSLAREFANDFTLDATVEGTHVTPAGRAQDFVFGRFKKLTVSPGLRGGSASQ